MSNHEVWLFSLRRPASMTCSDGAVEGHHLPQPLTSDPAVAIDGVDLPMQNGDYGRL